MQAARGTSLTRAPRPARGRRLAWLAIVVALAALLLDIVTKTIAVRRLAGRPPVHVVGDLLELDLTRNPGAAFSTGTGHTIAITVVAIVAAVVVAWFIRLVRSAGWAWALGLLLAGILGNLVDRLFRAPGPFRGHVVDFLSLPHWPVFNVADVCINLAALIILIMVVRGVRLDGSVDGRRHGR